MLVVFLSITLFLPRAGRMVAPRQNDDAVENPRAERFPGRGRTRARDPRCLKQPTDTPFSAPFFWTSPLYGLPRQVHFLRAPSRYNPIMGSLALASVIRGRWEV